MQLRSIKVLVNDKTGQDYYDYFLDDSYTFGDKLDKLKEKSELILVTTVDNTTHWLAKINFNLGECNHCKEIEYSQVSKAEGFKIEE